MWPARILSTQLLLFDFFLFVIIEQINKGNKGSVGIMHLDSSRERYHICAKCSPMMLTKLYPMLAEKKKS